MRGEGLENRNLKGPVLLRMLPLDHNPLPPVKLRTYDELRMTVRLRLGRMQLCIIYSRATCP